MKGLVVALVCALVFVVVQSTFAGDCKSGACGNCTQACTLDTQCNAETGCHSNHYLTKAISWVGYRVQSFVSKLENRKHKPVLKILKKIRSVRTSGG